MLLVAQGKHTAHARIKWRVRMSNKRGWAYPGWLGCLTAVGPNRSCVLRTQSALTAFCFPPLRFAPAEPSNAICGPVIPVPSLGQHFSATRRKARAFIGAKFFPPRYATSPFVHSGNQEFSRLLFTVIPLYTVVYSSHVCFDLSGVEAVMFIRFELTFKEHSIGFFRTFLR